MMQTWNLVKQEARRLMRQAQDEDLVMLWLSLPMLVVVLLWETLHRLLNRLGLTHTVRTHLAVRISTKISIWIVSFKIKLKRTKNWIMRRFGRV